MMRSTPIVSRIATSCWRMKLEPRWHWRAKYSDGLSESRFITSPPKAASCEPVALLMRPW